MRRIRPLLQQFHGVDVACGLYTAEAAAAVICGRTVPMQSPRVLNTVYPVQSPHTWLILDVLVRFFSRSVQLDTDLGALEHSRQC